MRLEYLKICVGKCNLKQKLNVINLRVKIGITMQYEVIKNDI